jgi:hypothetical protein
MSELEREADLQEHLERRSRLQRKLTEIDRLEPPEELDRIVLSRARVAIEGNEGMPLYRSLRSSLPFGLAATLVLVITVVIATHPRSRPHPTASVASAVITKTEQARQTAPPMGAAQSPAAMRTSAALGELGETKRAPATGRLTGMPATSANLQAPPARDAAAWLKDIRELRRSGRNVEAEREWSAFLKAHPEYGGSSHCAPGELC